MNFISMTVLCLLVLLFSKAAFSITEPGCDFKSQALEQASYHYLVKEQEPKAALSMLHRLDKCESNDELKKAQIADYTGETYLMLYKKTGDGKYAKQAESYYTTSLAYNVDHNKVTLLHLTLLYREMKLYEIAMQTLNRLLKMDLEDPRPALSIALMLSAEAGHWEEAKKLVDILFNKDRNYFLNVPATLLPTVQTLCHFNRKDVADQFMAHTEKYLDKLSPSNRIYYDKSKTALKTCSAKNLNSRR